MLGTISARRHLAIGFGVLLAGVAAWCAADWYAAIPAGTRATFVGRDSCTQCHAHEQSLFHGSNHDRAMEVATDESVLGDFNNTTFTRFDVTTRFFRRDGKFMVNTEGPDGKMHDYEIKYTFGIDPLQQYMIEFPDGRVQVLTVSWDVHNERWFMVTPSDVPNERILPSDPLHWTGIAQNWNTMCAECHSTNLQKNFDLASNTYHTTWSEIDVSCETCHGPGSIHVELAESNSIFWDRNHGYGLTKLKNATNIAELETCAPCHSRRTQIHPNYHNGEGFLDLYRPALLEAGLYYPDGQIRDEVYVYGSFQQSRMFREGIRCIDCHDPHSLKLKFPGNALCAQCHLPGIYDGPNHHHHPVGGPGTQCVECHMPTNTYMVIDDRHDHSLRVPRPDLSDKLGTPNACTQCHIRPEETNSWAAEWVRKWYGENRAGEPSFGEVLLAGQNGEPAGVDLIRKLASHKQRPDIVRATAVSLLRNYHTQSADALARQMMKDESPLVRAAAIDAVSNDSLTTFALESQRLLTDPVRLVRSAAAQRLARAAAQLQNTQFQSVLNEAIPEYREEQEVMLDRAASHINLAMLDYALGNRGAAQESLATAIRLEPYLTGPREQLATVLQESGGDPDRVRELRLEEVENLRRDENLLPDSSQIPYRKGMLLYLLGKPDEARVAFEKACELEPNAYDNWMALALICESQKDWDGAYKALERMYQMRPKDRAIRDIVLRIEQMRAEEESAAGRASQ